MVVRIFNPIQYASGLNKTTCNLIYWNVTFSLSASRSNVYLTEDSHCQAGSQSQRSRYLRSFSYHIRHALTIGQRLFGSIFRSFLSKDSYLNVFYCLVLSMVLNYDVLILERTFNVQCSFIKHIFSTQNLTLTLRLVLIIRQEKISSNMRYQSKFLINSNKNICFKIHLKLNPIGNFETNRAQEKIHIAQKFVSYRQKNLLQIANYLQIAQKFWFITQEKIGSK